MNYRETTAVKKEPEDTNDLFARYYKDRNIEDRNELVKRNLYLAEILSKKFVNRGVDYDDIYQVASMALIKSVERFDPDKGFKFVSFATPTIIGEIKRYFRDRGSAIRVPRRIYEVYQKVNLAKEQLSHELHRTPKPVEIAAFLNIKEETLLEIIESWNIYSIQSFDQNLYDDENLELHETIGSEDETFERIENRDFIEKSLDRFNDMEKKFIHMRYFNKKTQKEIADKMGVSQMYISRLERKVLGRFRSILAK